MVGVARDRHTKEEKEMKEVTIVKSNEHEEIGVVSVVEGKTMQVDKATSNQGSKEEIAPEVKITAEKVEEQIKGEVVTKPKIKFELAESRGSTRKFQQRSTFSVVNSSNGSKRISISNVVYQKLGQPQSIQVAFSNDSILLSSKLSKKNNAGFFILKPQGKSYMCYCADLVREITKRFGLDFSSRVSMTFYSVKYETINNIPAAVIKIA